MKYVPVDKLIAEIKRLIKVNKELKSSRFTEGIAAGYGDVLSAITSLQQEQPELPGIEEPGIPGKDFIPVEWVDACEMYGKWKIVKREQPEVEFEKELKNERAKLLDAFGPMNGEQSLAIRNFARYFWNKGHNARKKD